MHLQRKLDAGEFVVLAEIEPPKGVDVAGMIDAASRVRRKVDAFVVPEMSNAVMRMSALGGAAVLQGRGMATVMQVNCRDRNRLALQADLLAAGALGIANILAVTGENPSFGDHHAARAVNDVDLLELLVVLQKLQEGRDMAGIELAGRPDFTTGATVNAGLRDKALDLELELLERKRAAGATFFITSPVFSLAGIEPLLKRTNPQQFKILPTVMLLKSVGMARYMARNMANITIPEELIDRIGRAPDKARECTQIAAETVAVFKQHGFAGVLLATVGWESRLPDILAGF